MIKKAHSYSSWVVLEKRIRREFIWICSISRFYCKTQSFRETVPLQGSETCTTTQLTKDKSPPTNSGSVASELKKISVGNLTWSFPLPFDLLSFMYTCRCCPDLLSCVYVHMLDYWMVLLYLLPVNECTATLLSDFSSSCYGLMKVMHVPRLWPLFLCVFTVNTPGTFLPHRMNHSSHDGLQQVWALQRHTLTYTHTHAGPHLSPQFIRVQHRTLNTKRMGAMFKSHRLV